MVRPGEILFEMEGVTKELAAAAAREAGGSKDQLADEVCHAGTGR